VLHSTHPQLNTFRQVYASSSQNRVLQTYHSHSHWFTSPCRCPEPLQQGSTVLSQLKGINQPVQSCPYDVVASSTKERLLLHRKTPAPPQDASKTTKVTLKAAPHGLKHAHRREALPSLQSSRQHTTRGAHTACTPAATQGSEATWSHKA
jgi:hypothetical protein